MKKYEIRIPSSDGITQLHGYRWEPEGEVKAVVQLVHGMQEYIGRYDEFASYLTTKGIAVIGHDHLGHGESLSSEDKLGFFAGENGYIYVLKDMRRITQLAKMEFPGKPVIMLAHSMGSFFARKYITVYPRELDGLILTGTGYVSRSAARFGKRLSFLLKCRKGEMHRSKMLDKMMFGSYGTLEQWLCRNRREVVDAYRADPKCGFLFTVTAISDFMTILESLAAGKDFDRIPKDLPVLFASGMLDPVGGRTKGTLQAYNQLKEQGLTDVDVFFYKEDAHEILNEEDRMDVYRDILGWIEKRFFDGTQE